jgi:molecular chaperone GrpE (heat shock protein)
MGKKDKKDKKDRKKKDKKDKKAKEKRTKEEKHHEQEEETNKNNNDASVQALTLQVSLLNDAIVEMTHEMREMRASFHHDIQVRASLVLKKCQCDLSLLLLLLFRVFAVSLLICVIVVAKLNNFDFLHI